VGKRLSYADAVALLGGSGPAVEAVDQLLSGAVLLGTATAAASASSTWRGTWCDWVTASRWASAGLQGAQELPPGLAGTRRSRGAGSGTGWYSARGS
jgi:hypothetical protein